MKQRLNFVPAPGDKLEVELILNAADIGGKGGGELERDGEHHVGVGQAQADLVLLAVAAQLGRLLLLHTVP